MRRAKTIAVCSGSGGVGKTLVATNLAASFVGQDLGTVLLVDASHPVPGDLLSWLGLERAKSLGDMVPVLNRLTPEIFASYLVRTKDGLPVLPFVGDVLQSRHVGPELVAKGLGLATSAFDVVVLDAPSLGGAMGSAVFDRCDYACVVGQTTPEGLIRTRHCLDYLRSLQVPADAFIICFNRVPESESVEPERLSRMLGAPVAAVLPEDPEVVRRSLATRVPILTGTPRHGIARAVDRMARDLAQRGLRDLRLRAAAPSEEGAATPDDAIRALKLTIHRRLIEEIDLRKEDLAYLRDPAKLAEMRMKAESKVLALLEEEGGEIHARDVRRRIVKEVLDEAFGLGPLEDLLADSTVTEIMVNRHDQIFVERSGKLQLTEARFLNVEQVRGVIERIVGPLGRRIDEKVPMVDARLKDGSRVNAIIPPLSLKGPAITIRKFSRRLLGMPDLIKFGSLSEQMAIFLAAAVKARMNIVISGGTGSGKTTLLNVLGSFIPADERILTIEDAAELQLPQDHVVTLEARPPNIEGEGAITIRDLVKNSLRMRPDRIVVGECRGGEALDMLQAMNTGHDGSLTTVHANSPRDALSRLETMSLMAGLDLPAKAIRDQISSAVNLIVQQSRIQDGSRRVTFITEVTGQENGVFTSADVFLFKYTGLAPDGKVYGQFVPTGYIPSFVDQISRRGIALPREIFLHQTA